MLRSQFIIYYLYINCSQLISETVCVVGMNTRHNCQPWDAYWSMPNVPKCISQKMPRPSDLRPTAMVHQSKESSQCQNVCPCTQVQQMSIRLSKNNKIVLLWFSNAKSPVQCCKKTWTVKNLFKKPNRARPGNTKPHSIHWVKFLPEEASDLLTLNPAGMW